MACVLLVRSFQSQGLCKGQEAIKAIPHLEVRRGAKSGLGQHAASPVRSVTLRAETSATGNSKGHQGCALETHNPY
eukprot:1153994-Pelagomonas_calceolata.AAC.3